MNYLVNRIMISICFKKSKKYFSVTSDKENILFLLIIKFIFVKETPSPVQSFKIKFWLLIL